MIIRPRKVRFLGNHKFNKVVTEGSLFSKFFFKTNLFIIRKVYTKCTDRILGPLDAQGLFFVVFVSTSPNFNHTKHPYLLGMQIFPV